MGEAERLVQRGARPHRFSPVDANEATMVKGAAAEAGFGETGEVKRAMREGAAHKATGLEDVLGKLAVGEGAVGEIGVGNGRFPRHFKLAKRFITVRKVRKKHGNSLVEKGERGEDAKRRGCEDAKMRGSVWQLRNSATSHPYLLNNQRCLCRNELPVHHKFGVVVAVERDGNFIFTRRKGA